MLFNSIHFLIYFAVVTIVYFSINHKYRWMWLLLVSVYFYMTFIPLYILVLGLLIVIDYTMGILIENSKNKNQRKLFLWISIIATCLTLFVFKYFNFFNTNLARLAEFIGWNYSIESLSIILPIGLSFHTFQSLSYVIEVYWKKQKAQRHFGIYSLYVMFFPQLVAGPIERPQNLLHQFLEKYDFDYKRITDGIKLMLWGFFKKVVIADRLAVVVNLVYANPTDYNGLYLMLTTIFFAFQIYCDFSGYSDIAIGAAQVLGYKLMDNFNRPYFSRSISEFWRRWHISLSTWFKDYVYIPLGGNRVKVSRMYLNLFIVFLISGLWHGASWTYVLWGALHGFYLIFGLMTMKFRQDTSKKLHLHKYPKTMNLAKIVTTFALVCIGWVFFRANSISDAIYIITHFFSKISFDFENVYLGGVGIDGLLVAFLSIIFMETVHLMQEHFRMRRFLSNKPTIVRWSIYTIIMISLLLFGAFQTQEFIYFQF